MRLIKTSVEEDTFGVCPEIVKDKNPVDRQRIAKSLPPGFEVWPKKVKERKLALAVFSHARLAQNGCWEWTEKYGAGGYGRFRWKGLWTGAHRLAYQAVNGQIPRRILVCHNCDNPPCVNPAHLFLGTHRDNIQDSIRKGRQHWQKSTVLISDHAVT